LKRLLTSAVFALALAAAAPAFADDAFGDWVAGNGDTITLGPCSSDAKLLCGTLKALPASETNPIDVNNPDSKLKERNIVGAEVISAVQPRANGRWVGGTLYHRGNGKSYEPEFRVDQSGKLRVEACRLAGGNSVCMKETWSHP
jgi:uncharacterized protein (DUF2147 family)